MSAFATILAPASFGTAIELGNATFRKKLLPLGSISYQGRTLNFTRAYLQGLVNAWQDQAYDAIPVQFADASNAHTLDPERTRGRVTSMELADDGLYVTAELSERGQQVLSEHPYIGVSARIVEQYARSDGKFYPAAVQHVLATTDPRIPALGSWQPVSLANETSITIDLSNLSFSGEPAPAYADDQLTDAELNDFIDAVAEAEEEAGTMPYDPEYAAAAQEFDAAFTQRAQAQAQREQARQEFELLDVARPAIRAEDKVARVMARAEAGLYGGQEYGFSASAGAGEILLANGGHGPCSPPDEFGRCSGRYHSLDCSASQAVEWTFSNPPASTGQAALANFADRMALNLSNRTVWGDPDDPDDPGYEVPQRTIELAAALNDEWFGGESHLAPAGMRAYASPPLSTQDALLQDMGYELPAQPQPVYPGIKEIRAQLGI